MPEPLYKVRATRVSHGLRLDESLESIADETPIAMTFNGRPYAVMMATPQDLEDFAFGFSLSEGIVDTAAEVEVIDQLQTENGISLEMLIPQRHYDSLDERRRSLTGRSGCGLCGVESLTDAIRPVRKVEPRARFLAGDISAAFEKLTREQPLNDACGGLHAAAVITERGGMTIREDVGRHNAVDKALGAAVRKGDVPVALLATSRASYEVVHKAAQLGCGLVATISAPTALAVRLARNAGVTLVGFARHQRMTVYAGTLSTTPVANHPCAV